MRTHRLLLLVLMVLVTACATETKEDTPDQPGANQNQPLPEGYFQPPAEPRARAKAHTELAAAYYGSGNMGVALQESRIAVAADPTYAPAYNVQALVNMDLKDNAAAAAAFARGLKLDPNDPDLNHNYGWFLCQTGRPKEAIPYFNAALRNPLYSSPSRTYAAAGRCALDRRDDKQAGEYFERALRLDPNNTSAMVPYATVLYKRGRFEEARSLLQRYSESAPPSAEALWLAVRIERKLGDRVAQGSYATQLKLRFPQSPEYQALQRGEYD